MNHTNSAQLGINGGTPVREKPFPERPNLSPATDKDPITVFENSFATFFGYTKVAAVTCQDEATAYALAFDALDITDGEAVLPSLTSEAGGTAAHAAGLTVRPSELEPDSITLSPHRLTRVLNKHTKVVIANYGFGHPFAANEILRILELTGVPLIEDASAGLGSSYHGHPAGSFGRLALFSFGRQHLLPGQGAVLISTDTELVSKIRNARNKANAHIQEDQVRVALNAWRNVDEELKVRRQLAWELTLDLRDCKALDGMAHSRWIAHGYDCYVVRIRSLLWKRSLNETVAALRSEGIPCTPALGSSTQLDLEANATMHKHKDLSQEHFPVSKRLPNELIALPLHTGMTDLDISDITAALEKLEAAST